MAPSLIAITIVCYAGTGLEMALAGRWAWACIWFAYAVANIAMLVEMS